MPTAITPERANYLGEIYAKAADQYLISYLVLTRFPQSNPYSLCFTLAHCMEISIKAAFFYVTKDAPPTGRDGHNLEKLIKPLPHGVRKELDDCLPKETIRRRFEDDVKDINDAPPKEMLEKFRILNPTFDDELWMMLYATFYSLDIKYGADGQLRVLKLMQAVIPKLNKKALRLIATAREQFPNKHEHRRSLAEFIDGLPRKCDLIAELKKLAETGTAEDTPAYMKGDAPPPPLLFDIAELNMLRQILRLAGSPP